MVNSALANVKLPKDAFFSPLKVSRYMYNLIF